jgi:sensor domain CHASE-containing protein
MGTVIINTCVCVGTFFLYFVFLMNFKWCYSVKTIVLRIKIMCITLVFVASLLSTYICSIRNVTSKYLDEEKKQKSDEKKRYLRSAKSRSRIRASRIHLQDAKAYWTDSFGAIAAMKWER